MERRGGEGEEGDEGGGEEGDEEGESADEEIMDNLLSRFTAAPTPTAPSRVRPQLRAREPRTGPRKNGKRDPVGHSPTPTERETVGITDRAARRSNEGEGWDLDVQLREESPVGHTQDEADARRAPLPRPVGSVGCDGLEAARRSVADDGDSTDSSEDEVNLFQH